MSPCILRSLPSRSILFAGALAACVLAGPAAPPAHAGFGDLVKKAKDKAAQVTASKATGQSQASPGSETIEYTHELIELTAERLDKVLLGLKAGNDVLAGRAALVAKRAKLQDEAGTIVNQYGPAMDAARDKHIQARDCWREVLQERRSEHDREMQQKVMSDPALRDKLLSLSMEMSQAQAAGDTAAMRRAQAQVEALSGPTHADSLAAKAKCGELPPLHPMDAKVEALQREAAAVEEQIRANDQKSIDAQVAASGLEPSQFAMARERLLLWLSAVKSKGQPRGFSAAELSALEAHRTEIDTALAAWAN